MRQERPESLPASGYQSFPGSAGEQVALFSLPPALSDAEREARRLKEACMPTGSCLSYLWCCCLLHPTAVTLASSLVWLGTSETRFQGTLCTNKKVIVTATLIECSLCSRCCSKCFLCNHSFKPPSNSVGSFCLIDEETESQRGIVSFLRSLSWKQMDAEIEPICLQSLYSQGR